MTQSRVSRKNQDHWFGPAGPLAGALSSYEFRPQQVKLAETVADCLSGENGGVLAAEAPTGTGKTMAVLVPALLDALAEGRKILYLTSGISLQEQLVRKDIPCIAEALGLDIAYGLMKGRSNYLCQLKAARLRDGNYSPQAGDGGDIDRLLRWAATTRTGDLEESGLPDGNPLVGEVCAGAKNCIGVSCPYRNECFVQRLYQRAQAWDVIVANYHLFFSHLSATSRGFPVSWDILICDEAHRLVEGARAAAAIYSSLSDWKHVLVRRPETLLRSLRLKDAVMAAEMENLVRDCIGSSELFYSELSKKLPTGKVFREPGILRGSSRLIDKAAALLEYAGRSRRLFENIPGEEQKCLDFDQWSGELNEQLSHLAWCTSVDGFPDWAYWWDGSRLSSVPADCSGMIAPWIFDSSPHAVIALSATLAAEGAFDYWRRETGIIPGRTLVLDSPFPLREQMSLWIVDLGRPVTHKDYPDTVARVVEKLCEQNGGSTLVLLSSFRVLKAVVARLESVTRDFRVLVQGQAPRWELLREFREDESSVLVGSVSFREGIDVPGKGLSQVIIDRIPFPHPSDPLIQTLEEKYGRNLFHRILLPGAKLLLRQAAGRLIRSFGDSGRVAILDGRVLSRRDWNIPGDLPDAPYRKITIVERNNGDFQENGKAVAPK